MANNFTYINKTNNRLWPQTIEHKKITTYVNENPGLGTGTQRWQGDLHVFDSWFKVFNATFKNSMYMYLKKKNSGQKVIIIITVNIMAPL